MMREKTKATTPRGAGARKNTTFRPTQTVRISPEQCKTPREKAIRDLKRMAATGSFAHLLDRPVRR